VLQTDTQSPTGGNYNFNMCVMHAGIARLLHFTISSLVGLTSASCELLDGPAHNLQHSCHLADMSCMKNAGKCTGVLVHEGQACISTTVDLQNGPNMMQKNLARPGAGRRRQPRVQGYWAWCNCRRGGQLIQCGDDVHRLPDTQATMHCSLQVNARAVRGLPLHHSGCGAMLARLDLGWALEFKLWGSHLLEE
jgi:hypothetical protein